MKRKFEPVGPFAPPNPSEADMEGPEPMAVARDKTTPHDAAMPTTASHDAYTSKALGAHASEREMLARSGEETRAAESPEGYSRVDANGFRHLLDEDEQR
jgi:hypothetical protein